MSLRSFPSLCTLLLAGVLLAALRPAGALPDPRTGGKDGGPLSVLVVMGAGGAGNLTVDPVVEKSLKDHGYLLRVVSDREPLTDEYLRQFNSVVVVGLEDFSGGGYYNVSGVSLLNTAKTVERLQQYVNDGGGLIAVPIMAGNGSQVADIYRDLLAPWKLRIGWETIVDNANSFTDKSLANYTWTRNIAAHPVTAGVKALAYPSQLMRWDDAYPCNPLLADDPAWQVVARGEATSEGVRNVNAKWSPGEAGKAPALAAVRQAGKGRVAVVGLGGFYLITHAFFSEKDAKGLPVVSLGEATTGLLNGVAYAKGDGTTPSDWGVLFENMLRWTGEASTTAGLGGKPAAWESKLLRIEVPGDSVPDFATLNWQTQAPPPTWAHHLPNMRWWHGMPFYDEIPDPLVVHPQQMNKILIGAHSAYSDGKGTVAQWATAAKAAGFRAVVFTERFDRLKADDWAKFIEDCKANSNPDFACLQGMDIQDTFANHFLVLGNTNFPTGGMLTADGKALEMTARLSLGFSGHIAVVHRLGHNTTLPTELTRHFQGITVYTYAPNGKGGYGLADDALKAYTWQLDNASNPVPFVVHELYDPAEVAKHGTIGFQEIVPSQDAQDAIRYFRYGIDHFFENPQRYFISEGPIVDNYSIVNKDIGVCELNRDHFRAAIGASSPDPHAVIAEAVLYDRGQLSRRWTPKTASFSAIIDGEHGYQRHYMLVVTDSKGRRAITPHLRTVARGYYTRCGDRQNWFGACGSYTGIWPSGTHGINYIMPEVPAGDDTEQFFARTHPLASKMSLPFASNALTFTDFTIDSKYINPTQYGMDAWRIENVLPTTTFDAFVRVGKWHDVAANIPDNANLKELTSADGMIRLRKAFTPAAAPTPAVKATPKPTDVPAPATQSVLFPTVQAMNWPTTTYVYVKDGNKVEGKLDGKATTLLDLPAGASVGEYFLLAPLTVSGNGHLGWRAEAGKAIPAGTEFHASYLYLPRAWRADLGAEGATPWSMQLTKGKMSVLGTVHLTAEDYGIAGELKAGGTVPVLPLQVSGLNENWPAALWTDGNVAYEGFYGALHTPVVLGDTTTSGPPFLAHIGVYQGIGYAALPNKAEKFYVGNTLMASNPALTLAYTLWTPTAAGLEVNNPTNKSIKAHLTSAPIPGKYRVDTTVTVPAGSSLRVTLPGK